MLAEWVSIVKLFFLFCAPEIEYEFEFVFVLFLQLSGDTFRSSFGGSLGRRRFEREDFIMTFKKFTD